MATRMTCGSGRAPRSCWVVGLRSGLAGLTVFGLPNRTETSMISTITRMPPTIPRTMKVVDVPDSVGAGVVEGGAGVVVVGWGVVVVGWGVVVVGWGVVVLVVG